MVSATAATSDRILRLKPSVRSLLRSTVCLPTLTSIVAELVYNALDSEATEVDVFVDFSACMVRCADDGKGFHAQVFFSSEGEGGSLGEPAVQRYVTGPIVRRRRYGSKGESLSSMAAIGMLVIETTLTGEAQLAGLRWTAMQRADKILFSGPSQRLNQYSPLEATDTPTRGLDDITLSDTRSMRSSRGSEVTVRDIYRDMPLRRPSRLSDSDRRSEMGACRRALQDIALLEPGISLRLRFLDSGLGNSRLGDRGREVLKCVKTGSMEERFRTLACPFEEHECISFDGSLPLRVHSSASPSSEVRWKGLFLTTWQLTKANQYIYAQGRKIGPDGRLSDFSSVISHAFGKQDNMYEKLGESITRGIQGRPIDWMDSDGARGHKNAKFGACAFLVDICIDDCDTSATIDEDRVTEAICQQIQAMWAQRGLLSAKCTNQSSAADLKRPQTCESSRVVRPRLSHTIRAQTAVATSSYAKTIPEIFPPAKRGARMNATGPKFGVSAASPVSPPPAGYLRYKDPLTQHVHFLDERTGNSRGPDQPMMGIPSNAVAACGHKASVRHTLRSRPADVKTQRGRVAGMPRWLVETVEDWPNPVLARAEEATIATFPLNSSDACSGSVIWNESQSRHDKGAATKKALAVPLPNVQLGSIFFNEGSAASGGHQTLRCNHEELSAGVSGAGIGYPRSSLQSFTVLAQVSKKFIFGLIPDSASPGAQIIVCVDQHAADERVRFETLVCDYAFACQKGAPPTHELKEPILLRLPRGQVERLWSLDGLDAASQALSFWGFGIARRSDDGDEQPDAQQSTMVCISVTHVSQPVSDRLRLEVTLLQSILLEVLLSGTEVDTFQSPVNNSSLFLSTVRHLPPTLLSLFKSKACRGAIMFNDPLTMEQCERLMHALADERRVRFPLSCAHGRPSVTGICRIGEGRSENNRLDSEGRRIHWDRVAALGT